MKKKLPILREILLERSSEEHPLGMNDLIKALSLYGIHAERKSIYSDIETLRELGLDIRVKRDRRVGYYVAERTFSLPELKLLVDAVSASKFITEKKSATLIKKLSSLASEHDRKSLNRSVFVSNRAKSANEDIFTTVDTLHEAIENNREVAFSYFSWSPRKTKVLRRDGARYTVSPWAMVWDDENYYLIGFDRAVNEIRHYRVDKMQSIALLTGERIGREEFEKFDLSAYESAVFGMFGGRPERIELRCKNELANVMIDRFGRDVTVLNDGDHFRIHVNVVPSPVFLGWLLSFGGDAEIISPRELKDKLERLTTRTHSS